MKPTIKLLALLILVLVPSFFAIAKPENAPGIQKKTLQVLNVSVATTATTATISWDTNAPSMGSIHADGYAIIDDKTGARHSVTIPFLIAGLEYHFRVDAFSEIYGEAIPYEVRVTLLP
jgi:hypothetical protein